MGFVVLRPSTFQAAPSPRGKAEVCKTSTPGSNPGGASTLHQGSFGAYVSICGIASIGCVSDQRQPFLNAFNRVLVPSAQQIAFAIPVSRLNRRRRREHVENACQHLAQLASRASIADAARILQAAINMCATDAVDLTLA